MSVSDSAKPVIDIPASESGILIDSKGRNANESPYHFTATFSSAITSDIITYSKFQWCQPIYAHTGASAALYFDIYVPDNYLDPYGPGKWYPGFDTGDYVNRHFVVYHKPYTAYRSFDGNEDAGTSFELPTVGSYARDIQTAMNEDVRITDNNLVPVELDVTYAPGAEFYFRYSESEGFRITATYLPPASFGATVPLGFRLFDCPSIRKAHRVHGFGVESNWNPLDINRGTFSSENSINTNHKVWLPGWLAAIGQQSRSSVNAVDLTSSATQAFCQYSDSTPTLIPIQYIQIFSPELTYQRRLPSYRNTTSITPYGNDEMAIFPVKLENIGRFTTLSADTDSNVWSLREGYAPQIAQFIVTDEDGNDLTVSQCLANFFANSGPADPNTYVVPLTNKAVQYRDTYSMNYLLFGVAQNPAPTGTYPDPTNRWGDPTAVSLDTDVVHYLKCINV